MGMILLVLGALLMVAGFFMGLMSDIVIGASLFGGGLSLFLFGSIIDVLQDILEELKKKSKD